MFTPTVMFKSTKGYSGWMPGYRDQQGRLVKFVPVRMDRTRAELAAKEMARQAQREAR